MDSDLTITHMFTDESNHTRFKKMVLPLEPKSGLGSVGLFSSLFVNQILDDNSGDIKKKCTLNKGDIFRVPINTFHTMIPLTKFCIYHESKIGPFLKKADIYYRLQRLIDEKQMGNIFKVMLIKNKSNKFNLGF